MMRKCWTVGCLHLQEQVDRVRCDVQPPRTDSSHHKCRHHSCCRAGGCRARHRRGRWVGGGGGRSADPAANLLVLLCEPILEPLGGSAACRWSSRILSGEQGQQAAGGVGAACIPPRRACSQSSVGLQAAFRRLVSSWSAQRAGTTVDPDAGSLLVWRWPCCPARSVSRRSLPQSVQRNHTQPSFAQRSATSCSWCCGTKSPSACESVVSSPAPGLLSVCSSRAEISRTPGINTGSGLGFEPAAACGGIARAHQPVASSSRQDIRHCTRSACRPAKSYKGVGAAVGRARCRIGARKQPDGAVEQLRQLVATAAICITVMPHMRLNRLKHRPASSC